MSDRTASQASAANAAEDGIKMLVATFDARIGEFNARLPSHISVQDFKDSFIQCVTRDARLLTCDRASLFLALQKAAGSGIKPDGVEGVITIFGDDRVDKDGNQIVSAANKKKQAVFMPMWQGLVKVIRYAGGVKTVTAELIYEGEHARIVLGDDPRIEHERSLTLDYAQAKILGAYCIISWLDGRIEREWVNSHDLARIAAVSSAKNGPRAKWADQMHRKAPIRRLAKRLEKSAEMRHLSYALNNDPDDEDAIEGTVEDVSHPRQLSAPTPSVDLGLNRAPAQTVSRDPNEDPADASLGTKVRTVSEPAAGTGGASTAAGSGAGAFTGSGTTTGAGTAPPQGGTSSAPPPKAPDPFQHWAMDEIGEPIEEHQGEPLESPMAFAQWFEAAAAKTRNIDGLRENNMDAIGEAGSDPAAAQRITDAMAEATKRLQAEQQPEPQPQPEPKDEAAPSSAMPQEPMAIPTAKTGAPHWPNYRAHIKGALGALTTLAEVDEFIAIQRAATGDKAIWTGIDADVEARRAELGATPPPPPQDADTRWAESAITEVLAMTSRKAIIEWNKGAPATVLKRLKETRPDLYDRIKAAVDPHFMGLPEA